MHHIYVLAPGVAAEYVIVTNVFLPADKSLCLYLYTLVIYMWINPLSQARVCVITGLAYKHML